jgi:hypothetical protein
MNWNQLTARRMAVQAQHGRRTPAKPANCGPVLIACATLDLTAVVNHTPQVF